LGQRGRLREWKSIEQGLASALVEVECLRTLDRLRIAAGISETQIAKRRQTVFRILEAITIIEPTRPVLARASQPLPTTLGTLDAIHLATALLWKERSRMEFVLATHDAALALAARASGLAVLGA
jgi:predicted nucleic acid-binding protein